MERILIIGSGGAGKSTLARKLEKILGLPFVSLDRLFWRPGWVETPREEWPGIVAAEIARPRWIIEGNFIGTLEQRLDACDTVIFLSFSRWVCLWRVLGRTLRYRGRVRPDMTEGCKEKADLVFLKWIWDFPKKTTPKMMQLLDRRVSTKSIHILKSPREADSFLRNLKPTPCASS